MKRLPANLQAAAHLVGGVALIVGASCGRSTSPEPGSYLPDPRTAAHAVETALRAWRDSPDIERTVTAIRPVMFVDQQQPPGQRLTRFNVLGESPGHEGYRRFRVKLFLEQPDESIVVSYNVFGQGPIWVYRAEDLDMIMHMDKSMITAPPR